MLQRILKFLKMKIQETMYIYLNRTFSDNVNRMKRKFELKVYNGSNVECIAIKRDATL